MWDCSGTYKGKASFASNHILHHAIGQEGHPGHVEDRLLGVPDRLERYRLLARFEKPAAMEFSGDIPQLPVGQGI